jgi:endonuclease YncB( thermonuclease family)
VERWFNGTWLADDGARAWSRSVLDTAERLHLTPAQVLEQVDDLGQWDLRAFSEWWLEKGRWEVGPTIVPGEGIRLTGMLEGATAMRNGVKVLSGNSAAPATIADALVARAAEGAGLVLKDKGDEALIRLFGAMPTDQLAVHGATASGLKRITSSPARLQDWLTDLMYGRPGWNRYGMIHADYYDQALRLLYAGNKDRILTPQRLVDLGVNGIDDIESAVAYWATHLDEIDDIAYGHGLWTSHMLENVADSYARKHAAHIMYQPGATSMLGKTLQRTVSPFGPAQFDYMSWWASEMTNAATIGLVGSTKSRQIPNFLNIVAMLKKEPLGALPLNLRLMARTMDYGAMMARTSQELGQKNPMLDELSVAPVSIIEEFTFLPRLDSLQNFLVDFSPSIGPIPSVLTRMLPDPATIGDGWLWNAGQEVRRTFETLSPMLAAQDSVSFNDYGWVSGVLDGIFPNHEGSPRDMVRWLVDLFGKTVSRNMGKQVGGHSPEYRDSFTYAWGQSLRDRTGLPVPVGNTDAALEQIIQEAERISWKDDTRTTLLRFVPSGRLFYTPSRLPLPLWDRFVTYLPELVAGGWIGQSSADNLTDLWAAYQNGSISNEGISAFDESAHNILFGLRDTGTEGRLIQNLLILRDPALATAFVSRYQCVARPDGTWIGGDAVCQPNGSPRYPADATQDEINRQIASGREQGWYAEKPEKQMTLEGDYRIAQAAIYVMGSVYKQVTGRNSFDAGVATASRDDRTFMLSQDQVDMLNLAGVEARFPGALRAGLISGAEFARILDVTRHSIQLPNPRLWSDLQDTILNRTDAGVEMSAWLKGLATAGEDEGYEWPDEYPEDWQQAIRGNFQYVIDQGQGVDGALSLDSYRQSFAQAYGPLDYQFTPPPALADLPAESRVITVNPQDVFTVDGDTLDVLYADGQTSRYRLIGINAPDTPMPGADLATADLNDLLHHEGYVQIQLVVWQSDRYGTTAGTDFSTGKPRYKVWLYVDGQPVYDAGVFSWSNPEGISTGTRGFIKLPRPQGPQVQSGRI